MEGERRSYHKKIDADFLHGDFWFTTKSVGVSFSWLRRWRYRLMIHRAYSMGEATLFRLADGPEVPVASRRMLSAAWVRHIIWRRGQEANGVVEQALGKAHC